jgi:hypothetical protein
MKGMVLSNSKLLVNIQDAGFVEFNERTILDNCWFELMDKKNDYSIIYEEVEKYLATNIDMLDFTPSNRNDDSIKYYLGLDISDKGIPIPTSGPLSEFTYIGVRYYAYDENA